MQSMEHPRAPPARGIVRMDVFWSMWRSRTIPCPHGTGRPACETVLLHHEQFKIPENLARFAVRAGMTGFVKKLGPAVKQFVEERRQRVSPVSLCHSHHLRMPVPRCVNFPGEFSPHGCLLCPRSHAWEVQAWDGPLQPQSACLTCVLMAGCCPEMAGLSWSWRLEQRAWSALLITAVLLQFSDDSQAYGMSHPVNPPPASAPSVASLSDAASETSSTDSESLPDSPSAMQGRLNRRHSGKQRRPVGPIRRLQQVNAAVVAAGVAFALGRATNGR